MFPCSWGSCGSFLESPPGPDFRMAALMLLGAVSIVVPWVIRNAVVIRPGIMLSTVGGMNFYYGHNPDHYGWTADAPWRPGEDLEANRLGWELGLQYVRSHPFSLLTSTGRGTYKLFSSPLYALTWSSQQPVGAGIDLFEPKPLTGESAIRAVLIAAAGLYLALAVASLMIWRTWRRPLKILIPGLVIANWLGYAVVFFGDPRFRFFLDVALTIPIALVLVFLWEAGRNPAASRPTAAAAPYPLCDTFSDRPAGGSSSPAR